MYGVYSNELNNSVVTGKINKNTLFLIFRNMSIASVNVCYNVQPIIEKNNFNES